MTPIEEIKLEIGLNGDTSFLISDEEIQYFLDKHDGNKKRASLDVAKTLLFVLSRYTHERSGNELEIWNNQWFEQYMQALKLYISNPSFSLAVSAAMPYAGGISKSDMAGNDNCDTVNAQNIVSFTY